MKQITFTTKGTINQIRYSFGFFWTPAGKGKSQTLIPDKSDEAEILFLPSEQNCKRDLEGKARVWGSAAGLFDCVLMREGA